MVSTDVAVVFPPSCLRILTLPCVSNLSGFGYQSELELRVAEAARRQYNKLKMQTKAEIRQTLDRLLVGDFIVSGAGAGAPLSASSLPLVEHPCFNYKHGVH